MQHPHVYMRKVLYLKVKNCNAGLRFLKRSTHSIQGHFLLLLASTNTNVDDLHGRRFISQRVSVSIHNAAIFSQFATRRLNSQRERLAGFSVQDGVSQPCRGHIYEPRSKNPRITCGRRGQGEPLYMHRTL